MNESYYRIIRPTLPASGDFSKIVPLIVQSQTTSTPTMTVPDPTTGKMVAVEGHSSPRRSRIEKDLMQVMVTPAVGMIASGIFVHDGIK